MELHRRVCATIDLDAVYDNLKQLSQAVTKDTKVMAIIKADGYGHGAVPVARRLEREETVWGFGVAAIEEAMELRSAKITKPILLLAFTFPEDYKSVVANNLTATIFNFAQAEALSEIALEMGKRVDIHLAIDTGMNRIGFADIEESIREIALIFTLPNINVAGIFTHFARADELEHEPTKKQIKRFGAFAKELSKKGINIPLHHCSNSAAIMQFAEANMNVVRAGISIYGLYPSKEMMELEMRLTPAMAITSHITHLKVVDEGEAISYGGIHVTKKKTKVATIPVGYADGYARSLSNKGYILVKGQKAPILGRICMDQFMVDVSNITDVKELDEVTLLGKSVNEVITMEELGELSGRFNYEFACGIGKRVPRVYKEG